MAPPNPLMSSFRGFDSVGQEPEEQRRMGLALDPTVLYAAGAIFLLAVIVNTLLSTHWG